jgi:hypothetical protein
MAEAKRLQSLVAVQSEIAANRFAGKDSSLALGMTARLPVIIPNNGIDDEIGMFTICVATSLSTN